MPPLDDVAVKVTEVPVQIVVWLAATVNVGVTFVATVMTTGELVAVV